MARMGTGVERMLEDAHAHQRVAGVTATALAYLVPTLCLPCGDGRPLLVDT